MTDPQLSLIVTDRINPRDQVRLMPGVDAVCECGQVAPEYENVRRHGECMWPFCTPPAPPTKEDA